MSNAALVSLRECPIDFRCMKAVEAGEAAEAVLNMLGLAMKRPF